MPIKKARWGTVLVLLTVLTGQALTPGLSAAAVSGDAPYDAWALRESLRQTHGDSFGGLYAGSDGALILTTTPGNAQGLTRAKAAFDSARPAAPVKHRVIEVANSMRRLETLERAALDTPGVFDADGPVNMVAIDDRSNTLLIGLGQDNAANRAAVRRAIGAQPGEVTFRYQEQVTAMADRFSDVSPFNAGDRIYNENSMGGCSSGFGVHQAGTNVDYLLTAAHCSAVAGQQDFFWNGSPANKRRTGMGFSSNVSFGSNGWDTQLIRTESSTISWTATATRSYITASYVPVAYDGNRVINEGATSIPWKSGAMTVTQVNGCFSVSQYPVWGTVRICHLWAARPSSGGCAVQGGDSGGPVIAYTGYGPLAIGQIVAGNCSVVLFHAIGDMLSKNPHRISGGLRLNTTSNPG